MYLQKVIGKKIVFVDVVKFTDVNRRIRQAQMIIKKK
jgi:hypothetical protein